MTASACPPAFDHSSSGRFSPSAPKFHGSRAFFLGVELGMKPFRLEQHQGVAGVSLTETALFPAFLI